MILPEHFCWSRYGTEAGEKIDDILIRKERERQRNGGIFLWGIGNAVGPSMSKLIRVEGQPEVIFSPIRSAPKREDVSPPRIVAWAAGETMDGLRYELPPGSLVTSRTAERGQRPRHYALVCETFSELKIDLSSATLLPGNLQNLRSGKPIGASQVTSVVRRIENLAEEAKNAYPVAMRVRLCPPYFIRLTEPFEVPNKFGKNFTEEEGPDISLTESVRRHSQEPRAAAQRN